MLASPDKISVRQAVILFLTIVASPAIQILPRLIAETVGRAGWLAPLFSVPSFLCLVFIMQALFKKEKEANLSELFRKVFGNIPGKGVLVLYLIWLMILLGLYVRYFTERFLSSLLPDTSPAFFSITILAVVFYAVRGGIVNLARTVEFLFFIFTASFISLFLLSTANVKVINLLPVSHYDILPLMKTAYPFLAIWGYFTLIFFFGDKINDKENIRKFGLQGTVYLLLINIMLLIQTIGVYGHTLIQRLPLPYFVAIKSISLLQTIERIESIAMAFWVFVDFTIISVFLYLVISIIKSLFSLSEAKNMTSPIALFAFFFSFYIGKDRLELEHFSYYIAIPVNILLCMVMPVLLLVVGKIRKKV